VQVKPVGVLVARITHEWIVPLAFLTCSATNMLDDLSEHPVIRFEGVLHQDERFVVVHDYTHQGRARPTEISETYAYAADPVPKWLFRGTYRSVVALLRMHISPQSEVYCRVLRRTACVTVMEVLDELD